MTAEEAIRRIRDHNEVHSARERNFTVYITEALNMAIEALDKQILKKPQYVDTRFRHHGRKISDGSSLDKCYKCPNCNSHIFRVFDSEKCCIYCGQALDWSENND